MNSISGSGWHTAVGFATVAILDPLVMVVRKYHPSDDDDDDDKSLSGIVVRRYYLVGAGIRKSEDRSNDNNDDDDDDTIESSRTPPPPLLPPPQGGRLGGLPPQSLREALMDHSSTTNQRHRRPWIPTPWSKSKNDPRMAGGPSALVVVIPRVFIMALTKFILPALEKSNQRQLFVTISSPWWKSFWRCTCIIIIVLPRLPKNTNKRFDYYILDQHAPTVGTQITKQLSANT